MVGLVTSLLENSPTNTIIFRWDHDVNDHQDRKRRNNYQGCNAMDEFRLSRCDGGKDREDEGEMKEVNEEFLIMKAAATRVS